MGEFTEYASQYSCTVAKAISDSDYPMTRDECIDAFKAETGRHPAPEEIHEMRPSTQAVVDAYYSDILRDLDNY